MSIQFKRYQVSDILPADDEASGAIEAVEICGMILVVDGVLDGLAEPSVEVTWLDFSDDESPGGATVVEGRADRVGAEVGV
jgi:hypothetical protein